MLCFKFGKFVSAVLLVSLLGACASIQTYQVYKGNKLPLAQIAVVKIPIEIDLLAVNDEKLHYTPYASKRVDYQFGPGTYELVMQYRKSWKDIYANEEIIVSPYFSIKLDIKSGHQYSLDYPHVASIDAARDYHKSFSATIVDEQDAGYRIASNELSFEQQIKPFYKRIFSNQEASVESASDPTVLDNLINGWKRADAQQKQAFRDYLSKQTE